MPKEPTPRRRARLLEVLRHRQNDLTLVLANIHDPHNVSAIYEHPVSAAGPQNLGVRPQVGGKRASQEQRGSDAHSARPGFSGAGDLLLGNGPAFAGLGFHPSHGGDHGQ